MATLTKTVDAKGRVTLGPKLANRQVAIQKVSDTEYRIKLGRFIPEDEAWLYENPKALASVRRGLQQARSGKSVPGPDLKAGSELVKRLKG